MKSTSFSLEQRIINIERLLISALIFTLITYNLINQNFILEKYLGENAIYPQIILFFIFYIFVTYYFALVSIAISEQVGIQFVKFIVKRKSWIGIPLVGIIILSGIFILIFVLGYELRDILGPIIIALVVMGITRFHKISAGIKERLEQKQFDDDD